MYHPDFFIITGGPGVGKTTLLLQLQQQGYTYIPEVARQIIKEQMKEDGEALPWKNRKQYLQIMHQRSIESYIETAKRYTGTIFFDRGIIDSLSYAKLIDEPVTEEMEQEAIFYRYNTKLFLLPPWFEIYETDTERKQNWNEAVETYEVLKDTYRQYGYTIIEVPKATLKERADFVLNNLY